MTRGKALQPPKRCAYCEEALPLERHPAAEYCNSICRGRARWRTEHPIRDGIKCLECGKSFVKIGAHVVQSHGYERARDYRIEHGLDYKRGMVTDEHREILAENARENGTINNLKAGAKYRFKKGDGRASKIVKHYFKYKRTGVYDE